MMSFFLCVLLYKVVHSSILENPTDFIYYFGFTSVMFQKVSIPQILGQRVISNSDQLKDAFYNTDWYEQSVEKRKTLVTLMIYTQKTFKINILGFYNLNLEYLGKASENTSALSDNIRFCFQIFQATYSFFSLLSSVTS